MKQTTSILTVTDLHQHECLYRALAESVNEHRPDVVALVGDFLDAFGRGPDQLTVEQCAALLAELPCRYLVFVRGNHENQNWRNFAATWQSSGRVLNALHGSAFVCGPLVMMGFPCLMGDDRAYVQTHEPIPLNPEIWLNQALERHGPAIRIIWLMHETPVGTPLSQDYGPISGCRRWNKAIEKFRPLLTVSGHDHHSPVRNNCWHAQIRETTCVNVGQSTSGPLHYCLIEAAFTTPSACSPACLTVTAFPWHQSVILSAAGTLQKVRPCSGMRRQAHILRDTLSLGAKVIVPSSTNKTMRGV